jgi:hypothetical protein
MTCFPHFPRAELLKADHQRGCFVRAFKLRPMNISDFIYILIQNAGKKSTPQPCEKRGTCMSTFPVFVSGHFDFLTFVKKLTKDRKCNDVAMQNLKIYQKQVFQIEALPNNLELSTFYIMLNYSFYFW